MKQKQSLCAAILAFGMAASASAQEWSWTPALYGWLAGLDGKSGVGTTISEIDQSFSDIVGNLDFAAMLSVDGNNGQWGVIGDLVYIDLGGDENTPIGNVSADVKQWIITAAPYYRVASNDKATVDIGAGVRFMDLEVEISGPNNKVSGGQDWFDPMILGRTHIPLSEKVALTLHGDIGGFGVESDLTWTLAGAVDYAVNESVSLLLGYRHFDVDYEKDDFLYDTTTSGLTVGVRVAL